MFRTYVKIAWRNLITNKASSFINISGLTIGMSVAMLIGLWIRDELSFNKYHRHYDRIAQVMIHNGDGTYNALPIPLGTELRSAAFSKDFKYVAMASGEEQHILSATNVKFPMQGRYMQSEAPEMFTLKMLKGERSGLRELNSILLAGSLANKLFGDADPLGKLLAIDNKWQVKVTGVYEDLPENSFLKNTEFIAPWELYLASNEYAKAGQDDWSDNSINIFAQINPDADFANISGRIKNLKLGHISQAKAALKPALFLHPMSKWHLYPKFVNRLSMTSEEMKFVWFYGIIGVFVLLLASINFMNLSTARSEKRAKEVGIRKAIGSLRSQLVGQFFSESILIAGLSFLFSIALVELILPWFNTIAGKNIGIPWVSPRFWLTGVAFSLLTGLLAGSYPALYLSSFSAVKVLKGSFHVGRMAAVPRKVLVVVQFTVSIALIIGTIVVYRQIQFAKDRPVGYSREGLLAVQLSAPELQGKSELFRNELKNTGAVADMAESGSSLTGLYSETGGISWKGKDPVMQSSFGTVPVSQEYGRTIGWEFVDGRDFSKEFAGDSAGFVINEAAERYMGLSHPVGEILTWKGSHFKILGVVKDMIMNSPFAPAEPTVFFLGDGMGLSIIKLNPAVSASRALSKIEAVFKALAPSALFNYSFVDEEYAAKFAAEERVGKLAGFFAILAIFISCMGLFGLASFMAEQRTREIGLRKVLGASVFTLWRLLSKDFLILVTISLLIAGPLAYYFMHQWLQQYAYRSGISWWIFAATALGAMSITLLTISFQAIRAALMNPVKSLRTE